MRRFRETGVLAIDLVNTLDPYLDQPERLPDAEALGRFLGEYRMDTHVNRHDLERCRAVRGRLLKVLTASTAADLVGFALIFAAAATVLLQPGARLERDSTPAP